MTNIPSTPVQPKSRLRLLMKIGAVIAAIVVLRRFLVRSLLVLVLIGGGSYMVTSYKNPAPTPAQQEAREKQQQADLQQCGPPRPEWQEAELRQLSVCEAALKPVETTPVSSVGCWGREESRVCALHTALTAARERQEESERFERADKARHDWLVAHPGAQQTLPDPDRKLSPVKPTSIKPAPISMPAPQPSPVDIHAFQAYVAPAPVDPNYASLAPDKKRLVDQTVSDFLRAYRAQGFAGVNRIIVACYDRIYQLKTVAVIEHCGAIDVAALAVARSVGNAPYFNSEEEVDRRVEDRKRVVVLPEAKNAEWEAIAFATIAIVAKELAR